VALWVAATWSTLKACFVLGMVAAEDKPVKAVKVNKQEDEVEICMTGRVVESESRKE